MEQEASDNPALNHLNTDPTLICTAFKKNRFYLFSRRDPDDPTNQENDRDVFNEKPSKEDIISATEGQSKLNSIFKNTIGQAT